jgi:hypothetical protein
MPQLSAVHNLPVVLALALVPAAAADFPRAFHVAGLSGLKQEGRVDITLLPDALEFSHMKYDFSIPYAHISNARIYMTARRYEKTAEVAQLAGGIYGLPASVLILMVKKQVDVLVFDYRNANGGIQGAVLHVERGQGPILGDRLKLHGVQVAFPLLDTP